MSEYTPREVMQELSIESKPHAIILTQIERDTILAALRYWQRFDTPAGKKIMDIASNGSDHDIMSDEDIDNLCERINI